MLDVRYVHGNHRQMIGGYALFATLSGIHLTLMDDVPLAIKSMKILLVQNAKAVADR